MTLLPTPMIVGVDGTPASRHALLAAVELAVSTGSVLVIRERSGMEPRI